MLTVACVLETQVLLAADLLHGPTARFYGFRSDLTPLTFLESHNPVHLGALYLESICHLLNREGMEEPLLKINSNL